MSETKLPDIVERLERYGHLTLPEAMALLDEQATEITRLRSHAGWHEAREEAAKVADEWFRSLGFHPYAPGSGYSIAERIRALLPPGGEKG